MSIQVDQSELGVTSLLADPEVTEFKNAILSQIKTTNISLDPVDISRDYLEVVNRELRQKFEGKIFEEGYLIPGSIQLLSVGNGMKTGSHFTGRIVFQVKYSADYYVPIRGIEVICQILTLNKFGVLGRSILFPSEVVVPRQLQSDTMLSGGEFGVSALSPPTLNRNDLVRVKIIDYAHKSNSLTIVGVITGKVANLEEDFELRNRVVKLGSSLLQDGYDIVISEMRDDSRSENPFRYLNSSLQKFQDHLKNLNETIVQYNSEISQTGGNDEDTLDENPVIFTVDDIDEEDYEEDYDEIVEEEGSLKIDQVQSKMERIVKIIAEINKYLSSFTITDRQFQEISTQFKALLVQVEEAITIALENIGTQRQLRRYSPLHQIKVKFDDLEERISSSGFSFFDNKMKNEIEKLQNQLGTLTSQERAFLKTPPDRQPKIWGGFNEGDKRIYGIKQLLNPYELVPDRFTQKQGSKTVWSRAFYKFIEIDNQFHITERYKDRPMISYHIAEGPGGFVHAIAKQRSGNVESKNDRYYGVTRKFQWGVGTLHSSADITKFWSLIDDGRIRVFPNLTSEFLKVFRDSKLGYNIYQKSRGSVSNIDQNIKPEELSSRDYYNYSRWVNQQQSLVTSFIYDRHMPVISEYLQLVLENSEEAAILDWHNYRYAPYIKDLYPDQVQFIYGMDNELDAGDIMNNGLLFSLAKSQESTDNISDDGTSVTTHIELQPGQHYRQVDLVTADGATEEDSVLKELHQAKLFFHESLWALTLLRDGGDFVLKIFDIHRQITYELIGLLSEHFQETFIFKPKTSRQANTEKYLVCRYFKGVNPAKLATLRNLSNKWHEQTSEMAKYHFITNKHNSDSSSDSYKLVLNYPKREKGFVTKLERSFRLHQYLGHLENWQTLSRGEMYELSLTPRFYQEVSGDFEYRLEDLFLLRKEKNNLISTFLKAGFNVATRDQITSFQNGLYSNELLTLNQGVNELYQNVVKCLRRPDLIKETFGIEMNLNVSPDKLASNLLKHLNNRNDREAVRQLEQYADKWLIENHL